MTNYPTDLKKKVALVNYFRKYMNEHLLKVSLTPTLTCGLFEDHRPKNRFLEILNLILTPIIEIKIYEFFSNFQKLFGKVILGKKIRKIVKNFDSKYVKIKFN